MSSWRLLRVVLYEGGSGIAYLSASKLRRAAVGALRENSVDDLVGEWCFCERVRGVDEDEARNFDARCDKLAGYFKGDNTAYGPSCE